MKKNYNEMTDEEMTIRDRVLGLFRLMNIVNRLNWEYKDRTSAVDGWLDLRLRYGFRITMHQDFQGLKEIDEEMYDELKFIEDHLLDGRYDLLIDHTFTA